MIEMDGAALPRLLERETQASRVGGTVDLPVSQRLPLAWRVVQPPHVIHVPPLSHHLVAVHVAGPTRVHARFGGGRPRDEVSRPGDITVLPAGCDWLSELRGGRVDFLHILLPTSLVERVAGERFGGSRTAEVSLRLAMADRTVERLGLRLLKAMRTSDFGRVAAGELAAELASELLGFRAGVRAADPQGGLAPLQLRRAIDYMRTHLGRDITLDDIAGAVGLSPFHFARCFRQSAGVPPHRFLTDLRIARARELLADGEPDGTYIAQEAGFGSHSRLIKVFGAALGVTPGDYRRILGRPLASGAQASR